jgi:hypothetical protein
MIRAESRAYSQVHRRDEVIDHDVIKSITFRVELVENRGRGFQHICQAGVSADMITQEQAPAVNLEYQPDCFRF